MRVSYLDAADSEFNEAISYYNEQIAGLGFEFADEVKEALERIKNYLHAWTPLSKTSSPLPSPSFSLQHHLRNPRGSIDYCRHPASSSKAGQLENQIEMRAGAFWGLCFSFFWTFARKSSSSSSFLTISLSHAPPS